MSTVKIRLIPVITSKYFDKFIDEHHSNKRYKKHTFTDTFEWVKHRHMEYFIEQMKDFEPRLKFKNSKGIIEFETNNWRLDLRIITGAYIMDEVENIEIER